MAEKDFRVRKGILVDGTASGTSVGVTTGNIVVSSGTIGVTDGPLLSISAGSPNVSILSSAPTNGNLKLAPNGSGDLVIDTDTIDITADSTSLKVKDNVSAALDIKTGDHSYIKLTTTNGSEQIVFGRNSTFNGTTIADLGTVTTADIDGGTIDGATVGANSASSGAFTTLTASGNVTLGDATGDDVTISGSIAASIPLKNETIDIGTTSIGLNDLHFGSGGVVNFDGGDVTLTHSSETLTVAGGTLAAAAVTGTTFDATTDFTVGTTVISDDSIVMTPTSGDTLSITSTTNGASTIATADGSGSLGASLTINAAGTMNLQYNGNTKLNSRSTGIDVTGTLDASSTIYGGGFKSSAEQSSAGTGVDLDSSATFRAKEDGGVYSHGDVIAGGGAKVTTENMENTNFRTSRLVTETGAIAAGTLTTLLYINLDNTSNNKYHAVEVECAFQEKITSTNVRTRWLSQKLYACYDGNTVEFRQDNTRFKNTLNDYAPGEFCAGLWDDGQDKYLTISATLYEAKSGTDRTATFSVNANALSMPVAINA